MTEKIRMNMQFFLSLWIVVAIISCTSANKEDKETATVATATNDTIYCAPGASQIDTAIIQSITGEKGVYKNGEFKITIPQHDLSIIVDGFKIIPPMGLGTWVAFTPCADTAMVMGDLVLTETDLAPVQREVIRQGFTITAIHNHFVRNRPNVMYMHIDAKGRVPELAGKVKSILAKINDVRGHNPKVGNSDSVVNSLNRLKLDTLLGYTGEYGKGVYKYTIGRPDVNLREHGIPVSSFMGFNTWAAWQGSMEKAAVAGDFAMLENEVEPVIKTLIEGNIEVVAVHNHMVHENPRIFFLHYWGVGNADSLAITLRKALDQTGTPK